MRKLLILILFIGLISCNNEPPKKPFIVTFKFPDSDRCAGLDCRYEYTDQNGTIRGFCDTREKYNIGDTLK